MLLGALLAPGKRTVSAVLEVMGLGAQSQFQTYHRLLKRCVWSPMAGSQRLLALLVATFAPTGWLVLGLDDTIERRRGAHIRAQGIYRDPVRSSRSHVVKASGLRWLSLMLLTPIGWADRRLGVTLYECAVPFPALLYPAGSLRGVSVTARPKHASRRRRLAAGTGVLWSSPIGALRR